MIASLLIYKIRERLYIFLIRFSVCSGLLILMPVRIIAYIRTIELFVCFIVYDPTAGEQQTSFINTFPYNEGFETLDGGRFKGIVNVQHSF